MKDPKENKIISCSYTAGGNLEFRMTTNNSKNIILFYISKLHKFAERKKME